MIFKTVVPILYSRDVAASIAYYTGVLGFQNQWMVGDPPDFGSVNSDSVELFFCREGQGNPGTWMSIMVDAVDEYFEKIIRKGAKTFGPPETMEWGVREFLVEDPDGHMIRFGQSVPPAGKGGGGAVPADFRIRDVKPDNPAIVYSVVAEDAATNDPIGGAHLIGDNKGFFYVKDVYVHPDRQGRGIGTALMRAMTDWLEANAPGKASVWLHTAEQLMPWYKQFGFIPVGGMARFFNSPDTSA